jgi:hyaluronan synthase
MMTDQAEMMDDVMVRPAFGFGSTGWRDVFYLSGIIAAGGALMFLIVLLKSKTTEDFQVEPYFFSYAIFVTTFLLSRVVTAMFYGSAMRTLAQGNARAAAQQSEKPYQPTVAFVIPCKNEERDIGESIIQCFKVKYPTDKVEVIVVNDGSTDRTMLILRELQKYYPNLTVIDWPENQGKRWGMAAGFHVTEAEIIVQLDSDSEVDPETFPELIAPFRNPQVSAVCAHGIPKNADKNILTKMQTAYYFMSFRILKAAESSFDTVFCCSGCCSAYRRSAVMPVLFGWLDERFLGLPVTWGDDRALTSRLLEAGWKTIYASEARAFTIVPDNLRTLLKQQLRWKKSWIINAIFTSRFIYRQQAFVSLFYYFPLIIISFLTPIMTFRALFYMPATNGILPFYHIAGVLLLTAIMAIYCKYLDPKNRYIPYLFLWSVLNLFILSFVIVWAAIRIQDRGWGTR